MKLLRIVLNGEENPHYTIKSAFERQFNAETIWWQNYTKENLNDWLVQRFKTHQYDAVFMQLQCGGVITPETAKYMASKSLVFNWTGDVREDLSAYTEIGEHIITLFSNTTDIETMRAKGFRADYLQVGYDHKYYYYRSEKREPLIVFCGNNYPTHNFPLTKYRVEMVRRMMSEFPNEFRFYGTGWEKEGLQAHGKLGNIAESMAYNQARVCISLSHFNYGRYFSDRLLRIMACGGLALSHDYKDRHIDFERDEIVFWHDLDDLVSKCKYYLKDENFDEGRDIAERGMEKVQDQYNWDARVTEFKKLISKYK